MKRDSVWIYNFLCETRFQSKPICLIFQ